MEDVEVGLPSPAVQQLPLGCQPGSSESVPFVTWSVPGSPPFCPPLPGDRRALTHSPRREVASGPFTRGVPTPRLLGVSQRWRCSSVPALGVIRPLSLWVASPGVLSQPLSHPIGPWVVALLVTLSQRGCNICFMSKDSEVTRSSSNGLSSV